MAPLDFSGKTVLVVGGSSGIGNGIAQAFRRHGAAVHVAGTRVAASDYALIPDAQLEGLHYHRIDAASTEAIESFAPPFERLDVLVLSQGQVLYKRQEFKTPAFKQVVDVNMTSIMTFAEKFHAMLKASQGAIITISSTAAFHAVRGNPAYAASKAGAFGLTRTLGDAWARDGIRVNGIAPGFVATKMTRVTTDHPERKQAALERIPLGRFGTPADMAGVALFLASPLAAYVIGQTIPVDGGLTL